MTNAARLAILDKDDPTDVEVYALRIDGEARAIERHSTLLSLLVDCKARGFPPPYRCEIESGCPAMAWKRDGPSLRFFSFRIAHKYLGGSGWSWGRYAGEREVAFKHATLPECLDRLAEWLKGE